MWVRFAGLSQAIIGDVIASHSKEKEETLNEIKEKLISIEEKKSSLLDMKLEKRVNEEMYEKKYRELERDGNELIGKKEKIEQIKIERI